MFIQSKLDIDQELFAIFKGTKKKFKNYEPKGVKINLIIILLIINNKSKQNKKLTK